METSLRPFLRDMDDPSFAPDRGKHLRSGTMFALADLGRLDRKDEVIKSARVEESRFGLVAGTGVANRNGGFVLFFNRLTMIISAAAVLLRIARYVKV